MIKPSKEEFTLILDRFNINRPKCKCCNNDIYYDNIKINCNLKNGTLTIVSGSSYKTYKTIARRSFALNVCQSCFEKQYPEYIGRSRRPFNVNCSATFWAFDIPEEFHKEATKGYAVTLESKIAKYGKEEGTRRWENYCKRQAEVNTFEYKQTKYGWTQQEFKEYNQSRAVTKDNLIRRHGYDKGIKIWEDYVAKQKQTKSWDYMVAKYGEEQAAQINKSKTLCFETFIRKYGLVEGIKKYIEHRNKCNAAFSALSQEIFISLDDIIKRNYGDNYTTYFATKNYEKSFTCDNHTYLVDYYIEELNVAIEFNGDIWHGNPKLYNNEEFSLPVQFNQNMYTAGQLQQNDLVRYKKLYDKYNIKTYVIWEFDYKHNYINLERFINQIFENDK